MIKATTVEEYERRIELLLKMCDYLQRKVDLHRERREQSDLAELDYQTSCSRFHGAFGALAVMEGRVDVDDKGEWKAKVPQGNPGDV